MFLNRCEGVERGCLANLTALLQIEIKNKKSWIWLNLKAEREITDYEVTSTKEQRSSSKYNDKLCYNLEQDLHILFEWKNETTICHAYKLEKIHDFQEQFNNSYKTFSIKSHPKFFTGS